ncbi:MULTISPECIES: mannonate dehydratase [Geobacillus]|uniref:mannonate dehydratase n=1 Tax=Geobacillus thermocatenulatus TaxID=33938 RepID=A0A226Q1J6_9BACL|nr:MULTISPECIES: mannonate dehydratase [Geobacillus]ASS99736.1 mannonate dehydratase [Geobacillus thermocatenulatus]KLR72804.1 mannonate dehydratase [Geobacillus sp. T6]OXB86141.1 mannonate dehydratase [Geobacillus thermocatenulatus]RAN23310.1 mannonate dehydratase [Geobacillus sp. A8]
MMKISVTVYSTDLSDAELRQLSQLGVDCIDFGSGSAFRGVKEQGYPDLDELLKLKRRLRSFGLDINRVTLPDLTKNFMEGNHDGEKELENSVQALKVFGEAGIPIVRQRFEGDTFPHLTVKYRALHRGGAIARGEMLLTNEMNGEQLVKSFETNWKRFCEAYRRLVPIAEEYGVSIGMHPSDVPHPGTLFGGLGYQRIIDEFPSRHVGYIYCIGTRAEEGRSSLVYDEIRHYGRKGRIFLVHFRNVRGSLPTTKAFEEALLDDGDLNMCRILLELYKVGFRGCLNPDHVPILEGAAYTEHPSWPNTCIHWSYNNVGYAYSIGYMKALLAALVEFAG